MRSILVGGGAGLAIGAAAVAGSLVLPVGTPAQPHAGFFPLAAGALLAVVSIVLLVQETRRPDSASASGHAIAMLQPAMVVAALAAGSMLLDHAGFVPVAVLVAMAVMRAAAIGSWLGMGAYCVALSAALYLLFRMVLGVDLPPGPFGFLG